MFHFLYPNSGLEIRRGLYFLSLDTGQFEVIDHLLVQWRGEITLSSILFDKMSECKAVYPITNTNIRELRKYVLHLLRH